MKNILILTLFALSLSRSSYAQSSKKQQRSVASRTEFFTKEIVAYLTRCDSVTAKNIYDVNYAVTLQFDSLKALNLPSEEYRPAASKIYKYRDAAMKQALTPFHYDEYMMLQAEKKQAYKDKKAKQAAKEDEAAQKEQNSTTEPANKSKIPQVEPAKE